MKKTGLFMTMVFALALSAPGQVVLNFDDLVLPDYGVIPSTYGDNLFPNIPDIQYRTLNAGTYTTYSEYLDFWNSNYGDLTKVAFASANGQVSEITFVPAAGYGVQLLSFDMAGYSHLDRPNTVMRILDAGGNVIFDFASAGSVAIQGDTNGPQHSTFTPGLIVAGPLRLQWGTDWNIGIDNVRVVAVPLSGVPEPSTWMLLTAGAAALTLQAIRRKRIRQG